MPDLFTGWDGTRQATGAAVYLHSLYCQYLLLLFSFFFFEGRGLGAGGVIQSERECSRYLNVCRRGSEGVGTEQE